MQDQMMSSGAIAREFGVHVRTIDNWQGRDGLGFPSPVVINGRRYWKRSDIEAWKQSRPAIPTRKVA